MSRERMTVSLVGDAKTADDDRPVRIICHSLGARVVCSLLEKLHPDRTRFYASQSGRSASRRPRATAKREVVDSVALLGAAIGNDSVQMDER